VKLAPLLAVPLFLTLAACTGSLFKNKAAPPTMYWLSPMPSSAAQPPPAAAGPAVAPTDLAILKPRVRAGLDTDRISALYSDRRLDYFADVRWSGPLDEVLHDLAVQQLHADPGLRNVNAEESVFASAYWLEIEVLDFQAEYAAPDAAPTVHVHFLARVGKSADRRMMRSFEPDVHETAAANRMSAIVDAYYRATDEAFRQIAAGAASTINAK
jgi:ABC-type uncharacterized transport system auxiliary subunit